MIGRQHAITGQISAAWNVFLSIPAVAALLAGGALSGLLEDKGADQAIRILFLVGAAIMTIVAVYSVGGQKTYSTICASNMGWDGIRWRISRG